MSQNVNKVLTDLEHKRNKQVDLGIPIQVHKYTLKLYSKVTEYIGLDWKGRNEGKNEGNAEK